MRQAGGFRTVLDILLEPATALEGLREKPSWLLPLALVAGGYAFSMLWYFSILDIPWFLESLLYQGGAEPTQEQIDAFREQTEDMSPRTLIISGFLGASLGLMLVWVLQAGYLSLISALTGDGFRFSNWFCLATWTAIPSLLSVVGMAITLALNPNGQIGQMELDPLQLGNLGVQFSNSALDNTISTISLTYLWTLGLLAYGYRLWLRGPWLKSTIIALLPQFVLLGGLIALLASGAMDFSISFVEAEGGGNGGIAISLSL